MVDIDNRSSAWQPEPQDRQILRFRINNGRFDATRRFAVWYSDIVFCAERKNKTKFWVYKKKNKPVELGSDYRGE